MLKTLSKKSHYEWKQGLRFTTNEQDLAVLLAPFKRHSGFTIETRARTDEPDVVDVAVTKTYCWRPHGNTKEVTQKWLEVFRDIHDELIVMALSDAETQKRETEYKSWNYQWSPFIVANKKTCFIRGF